MNHSVLSISTKADEVMQREKPSSLNKIVSFLLWGLFVMSLIFAVRNSFNHSVWTFGDIIRVNNFTLLIWTAVSFFSAIVSSYSSYYLQGSRFHARFIALSVGFTISVMVLVMANHIFLFLFSWFMMGLCMSQLIGVDRKWGEAKEASKFALKYFMLGTLFLSAGTLFIAIKSGEFTLSGMMLAIGELPYLFTLIPALLIIAAALVQSAIYPFHRWLLSAMTSPTPASALMHAGFVNGSGILLALFASLLFASDTLTLLFVIGGLTAIIAQFAKLLQVNVKQKLACSTIAQMGFMIMQCGLGFFNAAVVHLILHGFYKAYLFLSSGEELVQANPDTKQAIKINTVQVGVVLFFGLSAALLFAFLTGKGMAVDSGIFLTLIVAITVGQASYNIAKELSLSTIQKMVIQLVLFAAGIGLYALVYHAVTNLMSELPMIAEATPLSWVQIIFGLIFLIGFFSMKLGVYRKIPWLYVQLMNLSQPNRKTVLMYKSITK